MNPLFKRTTTAIALSATLFLAQNAQAASKDSVCVSLASLGGALLEVKKLGMTEEEMIAQQTTSFKDKRQRSVVLSLVKYIYVDEGAYVDAKWLYLKCKMGDFD